jgi:hypothetical protein
VTKQERINARLREEALQASIRKQQYHADRHAKDVSALFNDVHKENEQ